MHPRLQTAFDVMYAKCEGYLLANISRQCTIHIRDGNIHIPVGEVAAALADYKPLPAGRPRYEQAVAAFGQFWAVFTEVTKEGV